MSGGLRIARGPSLRLFRVFRGFNRCSQVEAPGGCLPHPPRLGGAQPQRGEAAIKELNGLNELQRLRRAERICAGC
jgi:hypothetical protein